MADSVTFTLDDAATQQAFRRAPDTIEKFTLPACRVTADNIAHEAASRLQRQLGPHATGETEAGIRVIALSAGDGYAVQSKRHDQYNLPLWIEKGTHQGDPGSHTEHARPYFYVSAELEIPAHERRILEATQQGIQAEGLGE